MDVSCRHPPGSALFFPPGTVTEITLFQREVKKARSKGANAKIDCPLLLRRWAKANQLPPTLEEVADFKTYSIPMPYEQFPEVEAVVLTSKVQVNWILQLMALGMLWVLHIDGKHKLHHGKWLLVTFGTHEVQKEQTGYQHAPKISHSFRPLVYMFSKKHEDANSIAFGLKAMDVVARM